MKKGKNKCYVCGYKHTNEFPKNFPNNWKFCCDCRYVAYQIIKHGLEGIISLYEGYNEEWRFGKYKQWKSIKRLKLLNELVTVN